MPQASSQTIQAAQAFTERWQPYFAPSCPELRTVPEGWAFLTDNTNRQIYWININTGVVTSVHPHYGPLPRDWVLRVYEDRDDRSFKLRYANLVTEEIRREDPRFSSSVLRQQSAEVGKDLRISASTMRNTGQDVRELYRQPIHERNIRDQFEILHTIDDGEGNLGGMNVGVFVVRMKGGGKLCVEKRFSKNQLWHAKMEIELIHRLKNDSLTNYTAAFIDKSTGLSSIYLEFCDRGSLQDMMKAYAKHPDEIIPEPFIWHAYLGLADGLAYLQTGGPGAKGWTPIVHRDLKPDNVLLRSRSTMGSTKYPYCVLSDFGVACEDTDPAYNMRGKCGTKSYWAAELLYDPYPKAKTNDMKVFPGRYNHSIHSDVYSLGLIAYSLCYSTSNGTKHLIWPCDFTKKWGITQDQYLEGIVCRHFEFDLNENDEGYTEYLEKAVQFAVQRKISDRPNAAKLLKSLKKLVVKSGFDKMGSATLNPLPEWSTRVHTYHT